MVSLVLGQDAGMSMGEALSQVSAAGLHARDRKRLLWQITQYYTGNGGVSAISGYNPAVALQLVHGVFRMFNLDATASQVNAHLKSLGEDGNKLAKRVAKLRKLRNLLSHLDVTLADEVECALSRGYQSPSPVGHRDEPVTSRVTSAAVADDVAEVVPVAENIVSGTSDVTVDHAPVAEIQLKIDKLAAELDQTSSCGFPPVRPVDNVTAAAITYQRLRPPPKMKLVHYGHLVADAALVASAVLEEKDVGGRQGGTPSGVVDTDAARDTVVPGEADAAGAAPAVYSVASSTSPCPFCSTFTTCRQCAGRNFTTVAQKKLVEAKAKFERLKAMGKLRHGEG